MESSFRLITGLDTTPLAAAALAHLEESEQSPPPSPRTGDGPENSPRIVLPPCWEEADQCRLCHKQFGPFVRVHHCRRCGAAVCNTCSPQRLRLPQLGITDRVRVCTACAREEKSRAEEETVESGSTIACYVDVVPVVDRVAMMWKDLQPAKDATEEVELGSFSPSSVTTGNSIPSVRVQIERSTDGTWGVCVDDSGCITKVNEPEGAANALSPGVRITAVDAEPVATGAEVLAALDRNREGEVVLTIGTQSNDNHRIAPPPPLLPMLRVQQASAIASLPLLGEDARRFRVVCDMPPTDDNPLPVTYWVAASDDETQARTIFRDCIDDCLQPLLSPVIAHQVCQDCSAVSPTFNLPDQTVGRWCKSCAPLNHCGATNVVCHAVWLRELRRLVAQRRVVRSSQKRAYAAYLRLQPGFASSVEESHGSLEPGVYTFQLWFDKSPGTSLLFSLSLLLNRQQREALPEDDGDELHSIQTEPTQQRQAIFIQNERIDPETEQRFRVVVPSGWRGQLNASYRTATAALVNVRHKFTLDADGNLRRVRVLSMDGGGVRGTAEAMILMEILRHTALHGTTKKVHEQFDLICGTSTGGLFALALGLRGVEPAELRQLWGEKAGKIFSREWNFMGRKITEETQKFGDVHLGLLSDRLKYDHKNLEAQINEFFEGEFMDTQKWLKEKTAKVCVVSHLLDVVPLTPYVMRSYELPQEVTEEVRKVSGASPFAIGDWRVSCLEAGRSTSAAPTYFEPMTVWRTWDSRLSLGSDTATEEQGMATVDDVVTEPVEELVARPTHKDVLADLGLADTQVDPSDECSADQARQLRQHRLQLLKSSKPPGSTRQVVTMRRRPNAEVAALRVSLQKKYSLSTIVRFENRTSQTVSKIKADLLSGVWEPGWMPPNTIGPFEEVIWACGGTMWGRSNGGVVCYSTVYEGGDDTATGKRGHGSLRASASANTSGQTVTIEWDNPWVLRPPVEDIRRFEATVNSRRSDLVASVHTFDVDGNRATNPLELRCLLEQMGESRAYSVVEAPAHFNHDDDEHASWEERVGEARIEGYLQKKQPPPGFRWQSRWFHLGVDDTLRYYVTSEDSDGNQVQELKGVMHMRNVSAIDVAVGHETDFMIEHLEKPKTRQYHLRAESEGLRDKWLEKLREGWTPAVPQASNGMFNADEDGRSAEARRYKPMRFSDGGIVANNPTFIALLEAWALYAAPGSSLHEFVGQQVVLSLRFDSVAFA